MPKLIKNGIRPEFLSINGMVSDKNKNSSPRDNMFSSSHTGQMLVVEDSTEKFSFTGMERKFGTATFAIKFPCDAQIIAVIDKYESTMVQHFSSCPLKLIIYQDTNTREFGIIEAMYHSQSVDNRHQNFGYRFSYNTQRSFNPGDRVAKGTIIADSPSKRPNGDYCYGVESVIAFMGIPGIIEDGVVVSESFVKRLKTRGFEKRQIFWGSEMLPLNTYPSKDKYKIFPDIGEEIRQDGLLMALRPWNYLLGPVDMAPEALSEPDYSFDKLTYAVPGSKGLERLSDEVKQRMEQHGAKIGSSKVVDITVHHKDSLRVPLTPAMVEEQPRLYLDNLKRYHSRILEEYAKILRTHDNQPKLTYDFHRQIVESMSYFSFEENPVTKSYAHKENLKGRNVHKTFREQKIEEWMVELTFEYEVIPGIGAKLTDEGGNKGVITAILPDEMMPLDADGNRAEIIMDPDSRQKRMNVGGVYLQCFNAASRDVTRHLRRIANIDPYLERNVKESPKRLGIVGEVIKHLNDNQITKIWEYYLDYVVTCSQPMYDIIVNEYNLPKEVLLTKVLADGIRLWRPTDNPTDVPTAIEEIRQKFPIVYGPVTYDNGVKTYLPVLLGHIYILLLEKTGAEFSAASSAKLQHFGIPSKVGSGDKFSAPGRNNPVRILGEAEVRLLLAVVGSDVVAELINLSNNPTAHKEVIKRIHETENPSQFARISDPRKHPLGNTRPLLFVRHILQCAGIEFNRVVTDPIRLEQMRQAEQELARYIEAEATGNLTIADIKE